MENDWQEINCPAAIAAYLNRELKRSVMPVLTKPGVAVLKKGSLALSILMTKSRCDKK